MSRDMKETQQHIAEVFEQCGVIPKEAMIVLHEYTPGLQIVLHCTWKISARRPLRSTISREITLRLAASATQMFSEAHDVALQTLDRKLQNIVRTRLRDGYSETDSNSRPFIIQIDNHDLDSPTNPS